MQVICLEKTLNNPPSEQATERLQPPGGLRFQLQLPGIEP